MEATGARGSDVHTNYLIHCPVVPDQKVGVAVASVGIGQCGLCGGGQYVPEPNTDRNSMGISGSFLRAHGRRSVLPSQELPLSRSGPALHCGQHLSTAWVAMGDALLSDRCFLSGFNPDWKSLSRPSDRPAVFQHGNAFNDWLWRYRAA